MADWSVVRLEELASDEPGSIAIGPFGSRMKSDVYTDSGVPVIRGTNISSSRAWKGDWVYVSDEFADGLPNCNARKGDLVFPHRGSIGEVAIIPDDKPRYMLSTSLMKFRPDIEKISPLFLFYYFRSAVGRAEILRYSSQVGTPGIGQPLTSLRQFQVPVPPRDAQERIASILSALDDKIELNRRMNTTLEAMARAIFKDWFVDFGPTRAKAARRGHPTDPKFDRAPYLAPDLWDLFPDDLDDEDKPVGWELSEIGKEVEAVGGATPSTKEPAFWEDGKHHWATPKDLSKLASPVLLDTDRKITDAGVKKISSGLLPVGTVLLSSRAPIGYLAIAEVPTAVNQGFIAMVCRKRLPNVFVLFWCYENLDYIKGISGGSTFAEISKKVFRPVPVVVPSEQALAAYEGLVRPLYNRIVANTKESASLAQTRDLLLPKLMSGEIRLRDAEKAVEAVA